MISTQVEKFEDCIPELRPLFIEHWDELAIFKDRMPLLPDYEEYVRRERMGMLFMVTVRENGVLVGYYIIQVANGFHYRSTMTAIQDICYIKKDRRHRGFALPMFKRIQRELKKRKVDIWIANYKIHNPLGMPEFLSAFGFQPSDAIYAKWIGQ